MNTLKIGLLSFAHVHAAGYAQKLSDWPGVELLCADPDAASAPRDEVRGSALARQLGVRYVDSYEELWQWGPDAVVICSENSKHCELVLEAAQHGANVLCEKPLATTMEDGRRMVDACHRAGVFLMVAYPVRFSPQFTSMRAFAQAGNLGTIYSALGSNNGQIPVGERAWFTQPEFSGGGSFMDHIVHVADLLDALTDGDEPQWVHAVGNTVLHEDKVAAGVETAGLVMVGYKGGLVASIDCSWSQPVQAPVWGGLNLEVIGTEGTASIAPFAQHVGGYVDEGAQPAWLATGPDLDHLMLEAFLQAASSGEAPQPDGEVGLRTLSIVKAAQESVATGRRVVLS